MNPRVSNQNDPIEPLSVLEALRAYARAVNTHSADSLEPLLADDFVYESQMVFSALVGKETFLEYFRSKLETIRRSGYRTYAEMGRLPSPYPDYHCVVVAQGSKDDLVGVVLAKVSEGRIKRLDICIVPSPYEASRTGEYPV